MEGRLLARARARQEQLKNDNRAEEARRRREIYAQIPEVQTLDAAIRNIMVELTGLVLGRGGRTTEELEKESLALQAKRAALLKENGYPEDYLAPIYSCARCHDSGWADDGICECLGKLYKQEQTRELAPLLRQGDQTFANFRLDYYSPVPADEGQRSPRQQMERVLADKANWLAAHGYAVTILTTDQLGRPDAFPLDPRIAKFDLGINYESNNGGSLLDKLLHYPAKQQRHRRALAAKLSEIHPDITISMFCNEVNLLPRMHDGSRKVLEIH